MRSLFPLHTHGSPLGENDLTTEGTEITEFFYYEDTKAQRNSDFQLYKILLLFSEIASSLSVFVVRFLAS